MFGQSTPDPGQGSDPYRAERQEMIESQLRRRGVVLHSVLDAMRAIPRHLFVPHEYASQAYADEALPSQEGQTISQPFMVGIMTQELAISRGQRVLEIGTGTGYQTALLATLTGPEGVVCTIERVPALAEFARRRLEAMQFSNVRFDVGDGTLGWPAGAPWDGPCGAGGIPLFDRILVTAGAPEVPLPLRDQLADGGVMILPVGAADTQVLVRVTRESDTYGQSEILACRFVPLVGEFGWKPGEGQRPRQAGR